MQAKRIVFTKPNVAELLDFTLAMPGDDEVQVRLVTSTISSGTERANLTGSRSVNFRIQEEPEAVFPRYGGYSSAGIVQCVGKNVTKVKPGDPVALSWSTHSQYQNISQDFVYPISGVSFEDGALLHIATFPLAAIRKCRLELGESAIVMGMGVLGLVALQLLKAAGAAPIIVVTGYHRDVLEQHLADGDITFVHNPQYFATQMLDSLLLGASALPADTQRVLISPADVPLIKE